MVKYTEAELNKLTKTKLIDLVLDLQKDVDNAQLRIGKYVYKENCYGYPHCDSCAMKRDKICNNRKSKGWRLYENVPCKPFWRSEYADAGYFDYS